MIRREFLIYFTVVATGTLLDIAVAWSLSEMLDWPAPIAAMIGVLAGALVVYLGHEYWTFAQDEPGVSKARFIKFCLTVAAVLGVRAALVWAMVATVGEQVPLLFIFTIAVFVTFVMNFIVSKIWVFRQ